MESKQSLPNKGRRVLVIDPVPPPSDIQIAKGMRDKDYECHFVTQRSGNKFFACEYKLNRGHNPNWSVAACFELATRWKVNEIVVESVAYQRTLKWLIEETMKRKGIFFPVFELDKAHQSKYDKIVDPLSGPMSQGVVFIHSSMSELASQIMNYPDVSHDDCIECFAHGVRRLSQGALIEGEFYEDEIPELPDWRMCP